MKKFKAYKCTNCEHITVFKSFWKWLFVGFIHIDPLGLRWFRCEHCRKYCKQRRVKHITEKVTYIVE